MTATLQLTSVESYTHRHFDQLRMILMDARTQQLLTAPPASLLVKMATPNALAFLIQGFVSMAEVWFISRLGTTSLAAIALAFPLLMLTQMMSGGAIGGAVASAVARALGAGNVARAEQLIWHALVIVGLGASTFLGAFLLFGEIFLGFLGGSDGVLAEAMAYCLVLFTGGVFIWFMSVMSAVFRGTGDMQFPALIMVLGACIQVPLTGCLVMGAFGLPAFGIVGAAVSAIVSAAILSLIFLWRLIWGRQTLKLHWHARVLSRELFRDISKVAVPASLSPLLTILTVLSLTSLVGRFGEAALAGYGIGSRVEMLLVPLVFGLGAAMTSLVGLSLGAGNLARAERIGWLGGTMAAGVAGMVGLLLALFPSAWIGAFTSDPATFASAKSYIQIVGPCFAFQGLGLSLYFASQGAGRMAWPILATILRILLAVGGALLLAFYFDFGLKGIYIAAGTGMVAYGVMIGAGLKLGVWR